jgi:hypothetical protein
LRQSFGQALLAGALDIGAESERFLADSLLNDFLETDKSAAADKQDISRVYREELLVGMLASSLRRNIRHRAFKNFQ